jgi:glycosyltransferase involved in cell wall biosynthesis
MKILVVARTLKQSEGISEWILNYYSRIAEKQGVSIDLLIEERDSEFQKVKVPKDIKLVKIHSMKNSLVKYILDWKRLAQNIDSKYDYVHIHLDNLTRFFYLLMLKDKKNVILHSHNSFNNKVESSHLKHIMHRIGKYIVKKGNFIHFACSDLAAKWLFSTMNYIQVNNGVDLSEFKFNERTREKYKKELHLNGFKVYGHIGRFAYQKNHERLVYIFKKIHDVDSKTKLLLIGTGPKMSEIKKLVVNLNISESVIFLNHRDDVKDILNVIDCIIFPSRYEGLPISLVEAQANGIPIFYANTITREIELLPMSTSFSLQENNDKISEMVINARSLDDRKEATSILKNQGYDRVDVIEQLYRFYQTGSWK